MAYGGANQEVTRMNIMEAEFIKSFIRVCSDGWELGWHERNGGNLSYRIKSEEIDEVKAFFNIGGAWLPIGCEVGTLS